MRQRGAFLRCLHVEESHEWEDQIEEEKREKRREEKSLLCAVFRCKRCLSLQCASSFSGFLIWSAALAWSYASPTRWRNRPSGKRVWAVGNSSIDCITERQQFFFRRRRLNLRDSIINFFLPWLALIRHLNSLSGPSPKRSHHSFR